MKRNAYLLLILATLFWGGNAIAGKMAVGHIGPMMLNCLRWFFSALILLWLARPYLAQDWQTMRKHGWLLFILGAGGMTGFSVALYQALHYTTAINASIEQASMPLIIFIANFLIFGMRVTLPQMAGFVISLIGVMIVVSHGSLANLLALDLNLGDAIMIGGVVLYGIYTVLLRNRPNLHWQSFMLAIIGAGFVSSLPFVAYELLSESNAWPDLNGWLLIAYVAIFPSLLSQIFYLRGVEAIGANRAAGFYNLMPIFGTILSILLLGERFEIYHGIAIIMVLGGIFLAERGERFRRARQAA